MTKRLPDRPGGGGTTLPTPDLVHSRTMKSREGVTIKDSGSLWTSHPLKHINTPSLGTSSPKPLYWDRHCSGVQVPLLRPPMRWTLIHFSSLTQYSVLLHFESLILSFPQHEEPYIRGAFCFSFRNKWHSPPVCIWPLSSAIPWGKQITGEMSSFSV